MIDALRSDEIVRRIGGKFRFTALVQRRWQQLMEGARPMVERQGRSDLELVIEEIRAGKIVADESGEPVETPEETL